MPTPRLGAPELANGQAVPETTVNEQIRWLEQGASHFIAKDKDLTAPPGSPSDGDCYIVASSPTGAWSGQAGKLAFRMSTGWLFITPIEGTQAYLQDENTTYTYSGSAWVADATGDAEFIRDTIGTALVGTSGGGVGVTVSDGSDTITVALSIPVTSQSGTTYTAVLADGNSRVRFTNASPVTFTIPTNASVAYPVGTFIEFEQAGGGAVTAVGDTGVTLVNRSGFDVTAGQYAVAGVRKVATNEWSLTGDLA